MTAPSFAPSLIPKRPGERVKTNRRDAITLARLHRAGELPRIWVPDPGHEAVRELVRAREAAMADLRTKRQHLPESGRTEARTGLRMMPTFPRSPLSYGEFSPVRLEGWPVRRGLPNTVSSLSLLPACAGHRPVCVRPSRAS